MLFCGAINNNRIGVLSAGVSGPSDCIDMPGLRLIRQNIRFVESFVILKIDILEFELVRLIAYEIRGLVNNERD